MSDNTTAVELTEIPERRIRLLPILALLLGAAILTLILTVAIHQAVYAERIHLGVEVLGLDLGGLTRHQAQAFLEQQIRYYGEGQMVLRYGERTWRASPHELGADLDAEATVDAAYRLGREDSLQESLRRQLDLLLQGQSVWPVTDFDAGRAAVYLSRLAREIELPPRNAELAINGLEVQVTPSQVGRQLDVEATLELIRGHAANLSSGPIDLVVREVPPTLADVSETKALVEQMIGSPLTLTFADRTWTLDRSTLADMILFYQEKGEDGQVHLVPILDEAKVRAFVEPLAPQIHQLPRNARLDFDPDTGALTPIVMSQEGRTLDVEETVRRIKALAMTPQRMVPLAVIVEKPAVDVADVDHMGIVELTSKGTTHFKGSPAGRVKNIQIAASKFHGVVIPPGGIFSFNEYLGEVSAEEGYEEAYIIYGSRTTIGLGGGICQVATTAFRAAFWGGYPIVERWAHGYRVRWYEPPVGLDATVYSPLVDFKFQNDTPHYLLIETEVDAEAGTLTFYFYGTRPDRTVEIEGPFEENPVPHGLPIYEEDPELPKGTVKQIDWAKDGLDVTIYRLIKQGDKVLKREKFFSRYRPWQDVYLVGTKEE
ncbi:MAG: VanW family protein [Anaerolineae bacterium]